uniref:LOW QUALITY PROTEIN: RAD51-associated protein 1-like n=1 Tax=Panthera onca TaxID=9690 RepID=UPI0029536E48|nr:LOW QUALITY PROTEIN: RAD51-associated protein 1-like [Panthera onca]
MVRPVRHKKSVTYSQFEDSDSDDDFISATAPLNKKPRTTPKELKLETRKPKLKNLQKEDIPLQEKTPKKRMALDDKLYQRDLEVALALSVKELPTVTTDAEEAQDKSTEKCDSHESETMSKAHHISNCSVASDYLDLDKITEEDDFPGVQGKRKWVPPAMSGSSSIRSPLAGVSVKSPNQSLRQGLSRLARVKPLHPNAASS